LRKKYPDGKPYVSNNPARDIPKFKYGSTGFHTWTPEKVRQFEERHPIGSKARLALAILLFTGQRRADVIRFGKQHVRNGKLMFTQRKVRNRKPKQLTLPILPAQQGIIDASTCGDLTFLVNDLGRAFTDAGFGNKMREWCDQAELPNCSAHGLRKAGATFAANNGATSRQLMAIFGWESINMAELCAPPTKNDLRRAQCTCSTRGCWMDREQKRVPLSAREWDFFRNKKTISDIPRFRR
jgi:integrase